MILFGLIQRAPAWFHSKLTIKGPTNSPDLNNPKAPKLEEITLITRRDGTFFTRFTTLSEMHAQSISNLFKSLGLKSDYISGKYINFTCADPELMAYVTNQVVFFDDNNLKDKLPEIYQQLKVLPDPQFQIPQWYRDGNYFYDIQADNSHLKNLVEFVNTQAKIIQSIKFCGYKDNNVRVFVKSRHGQTFDKLVDALKKEGFPEPSSVDKDFAWLSFENHDMNLISHFIATLAKMDPSFVDIKSEVSKTLNINLDQKFAKHRWIMIGNFENRYESGALLDRSFEIEYTKPSKSPLKKIALLGYKDGSMRIRVDLKKGQNIQEAIKKAKIQFPQLILDESLFKESLYFDGNQSNVQPFVNVLRFIKSLVGDDFKEVEKQILDALKIRMRSLFERAIDDIKAQTSPVRTRRSGRIISQKAHLRAKGIFSDMMASLDEVCDDIEKTTDEIVEDMTNFADELVSELEGLVIEAGVAVDETFDLIQQRFRAMTLNYDNARTVPNAEARRSFEQSQESARKHTAKPF